MPGLLVYKASAGSGKTFQLTRQYLELLFREEKNYSSILAVTFTNKAAGELKDRVLAELVAIGRGELHNSSHFDYLSDILKKGADILVPRAKRILRAILEDYSHFSIGTIDEFFQSILRSFAKDLGISSGYQVELNSRKLIIEAIQNLIEKAGSDPDLFRWILDGIGEKIAEGKAWRRFEKELYDLGTELIKEQLSVLIINNDQDNFSKDKIRDFRKELLARIESFKKRMNELSGLTSEALEKSGLSFADFSGKSKSPVAFLESLKNENYDPKAKRSFIDNPNKWLAKSCPKEISVPAIQLVNDYLNGYLIEACNLFDKEYPLVNLSELFIKQLSRLGLLTTLANEIILLSKEKELFLISFTNPIIAKLVQDNPAPFIYERTGRYFKHYMIDEFQDTSDMQWNNFIPLIKESLSSGGHSMLVGDAKQSIYRWRNSNWRLIESKAEADLSEFSIQPRTLKKNFRSRESIVDFINHFFSKAGDNICQILENEIVQPSESVREQISAIENLYAGVMQGFGNSNKGGFVRLNFIEKETVNSFPRHFNELLNLVEHLQLTKKYLPNDIVFLVRKNKEASEIIRYFVAHKETPLAKENCIYDVVSAESLRLDASAVIRTILAFFSLEENPDNHSFLARFTLELLACKSEKLKPAEIKVLGSRDKDKILKLNEIDDFDELITESKELNYFEKIEYLIHKLNLKSISGSYPFILSFKEHFYGEFRKASTIDLKNIIEWWEDTGRSLMVPMNEKVNAMRVMSIHKAKGLEFPVVIIPNCNWEFDHAYSTSPMLWLDTANTPFDKLPIVPIKYQKALIGTPFAEVYYDEKIQTFLDNLNLLYVALTRAADRLHVFVPKSKRKSVGSVGSLLESIAQPDENGLYEFGDESTFNKDVTSLQSKVVESMYYPANSDLTHPDQRVYSSKELVRGKVLHGILEQIVTIDDINPVIDELLNSEILDVENAEILKVKLNCFIGKPELLPFYNGKGKVYNEKSFLLPGKGEIRADRLVFLDDKVIVIEYKTGQVQDQHRNQVKKYIQGLRHMGYAAVEGYLLYLDSEEVVAI